MIPTFRLESHQRYPQLKFAFVDGDHEQDFAVHRHDFSELFLVVSGSGTHTVASHSYPLKKGDVFVINGDVEHGFQTVNNLKIINLMFDTEVPFFETPSIRRLTGYQALFKVEPIARKSTEYKAKLSLNIEQQKTALILLESIRDEYQNNDLCFDVMITSLLQQFVIHISRQYQNQTENLPQTTLTLSRALSYIDQNLTNGQMNSESIAEASYVSKRQLERLFKKFLNTSPNQYIRKLKINYATTLLHEKEMSIVSIANACGFEDSNYFSKCFKEQIGLTPREYRSVSQ